MSDYAKRRAEFRCTRCGAQDWRTNQGFSQCSECAKQAADNSRLRYARNKTSHRCTRCGGVNDRPDHVLCTVCAKISAKEGQRYHERCGDLLRERRKKRYRDRIARRVCASCAVPLPEDWTRVLCEKCAERDRLSRIRRAAKHAHP